MEGNFLVKRKLGTFSMLPPNKVIEQKINIERNGAGGIIGNRTSAGVLQQYILSSQRAAIIFGDLRRSINLLKNNSKLKCTVKKTHPDGGFGYYELH